MRACKVAPNGISDAGRARAASVSVVATDVLRMSLDAFNVVMPNVVFSANIASLGIVLESVFSTATSGVSAMFMSLGEMPPLFADRKIETKAMEYATKINMRTYE